MKYKISWWVTSHPEGITRGSDIVESEEEIDEFDAEDILQNLAEKEGTNIGFELGTLSNPSNYGVLKVTKLEEPLKEE